MTKGELDDELKAGVAKQGMANVDNQLMSRVAKGETEALGQLYLKYCALVKRALRRFAPRISDAELEDLCQDVFIELQKSAKSFPEDIALKTWLFAISANLGRNAGRKSWGRLKLLRQFVGERLPFTPPLVPMDVEIETRDMVTKAFEILPERHRQVLLLHVVDGFSGEEIGRILNLKPQAVWTRLHRARRELKKALNVLSRESSLEREQTLLYERDS